MFEVNKKKNNPEQSKKIILKMKKKTPRRSFNAIYIYSDHQQ